MIVFCMNCYPEVDVLLYNQTSPRVLYMPYLMWLDSYICGFGGAFFEYLRNPGPGVSRLAETPSKILPLLEDCSHAGGPTCRSHGTRFTWQPFCEVNFLDHLSNNEFFCCQFLRIVHLLLTQMTMNCDAVKFGY